MVNPDDLVLWRRGEIALNATVAYTWVVMAILAGTALLVTRRLSVSTQLTRGQNLVRET